VNVGLGSAPLASCPPLDRTPDGKLRLDELVAAIHTVVNGCAAVAAASQ
jgi:hypothetical protein